ncbi:MAG: carboxymuconolactone decarboxylase family protein [Planctomycetota bacterium]
MADFTVHTPESAPEATRPLFERSKSEFGMLPNLHAVMGESPELLDAYQTLWGLMQKTSFSPLEQQVVMQTANVENECHYCVPAHGTMVLGMTDEATARALAHGEPLGDAKLEALRAFTLDVLRTKGRPSKDATEAFFAAGYGTKQALEVVVGLATKVLSNYTNALAGTPLDAPFVPAVGKLGLEPQPA